MRYHYTLRQLAQSGRLSTDHYHHRLYASGYKLQQPGDFWHVRQYPQECSPFAAHRQLGCADREEYLDL
jgi:hypothetical protein